MKTWSWWEILWHTLIKRGKVSPVSWHREWIRGNRLTVPQFHSTDTWQWRANSIIIWKERHIFRGNAKFWLWIPSSENEDTILEEVPNFKCEYYHQFLSLSTSRLIVKHLDITLGSVFISNCSFLAPNESAYESIHPHFLSYTPML